ncbi:MAG: hypothetical protein ACM3QW_07055 [Ignavibacteriales bacterium]
MVLTFLNKESHNNLDLSVFIEYPPDLVLDFFQQSHININLTAYQGLKMQFADAENFNENIHKWTLFIDRLLDMEGSLVSLEENSNISCVGPAYYTKTNTRFFFFKSDFEHDHITSEDIAALIDYNSTPSINDMIAKYYANFKAKPSAKKTREELISDLDMSIMALDESIRISQRIAFQAKLLEERERFLNAPYSAFAEPDLPPEKPEKPVKTHLKMGSIFTRLERRSGYYEACQQYNHDLKVYFINYREYEKACERYKAALKEWEDPEKDHLICRSIEDIKKAKLKIKKGHRLLKIYSEVVNSLDIHPQYQIKEPLERFRHFLKTGRASNLQECMNLYEQEIHWEQLKESQARLEKNIMATVYYLHSEAAATSDVKPSYTPENFWETVFRKVREGIPSGAEGP